MRLLMRLKRWTSSKSQLSFRYVVAAYMLIEMLRRSPTSLRKEEFSEVYFDTILLPYRTLEVPLYGPGLLCDALVAHLVICRGLSLDHSSADWRDADLKPNDAKEKVIEAQWSFFILLPNAVCKIFHSSVRISNWLDWMVTNMQDKHVVIEVVTTGTSR
ncbi:hypothetical protein J6590_073566 [Homalodisca vitripennis]|nr:hypothetical protein J6590_073566 [Homalodisca vitripennis]